MTAIDERTGLDRAPAPLAPRRPLRSWQLASLLGLIATVVTGAFSWVPSLWYDEGATVTATTRDVDALGVLVSRVDVVHALYYWLMHQWFDLVGYSAVALRVPSILAAGIAVALTVLLVERLATRRLAVIAAVVLIAIPRFSWAGGEGRSYALGLALATLSTLLLVLSIEPARSETRRRVLWTAFAVVTGLSIVLYLYLVFLLAAQAVAVVALVASRRLAPRRAAPFALVTAAVLLATAPLLVVAESQKGQVGWIHPLDATTPHAMLVTQFFPKAAPFALIGGLAAVVGIALLLRAHRARPVLVAMTLATLVVPTLTLLVATVVITPLYSPRYLTFSLPALAILIAVAIDALPRRALRIVALLAVLAIAAPPWVAQRMPEAKQHSDWSQVAAYVESESRELAPEESTSPGTPVDAQAGVVWGGLREHPTSTSRVIAQSYPASFAGLDDINAAGPPRGLWQKNTRLTPDSLDGYRSVWYVVSNHSLTQDEKFTVFAEAGFALAQTEHFSRTDVYLFTRD